MADKSRDAFRTISEVADWLGVQPHVLRFWESKFSQVKPVKRAGGRRYYRPADMQLLGGIRKLLHEDGLTIKGAQKVLREAGMAHVSAMSPPLDTESAQALEASASAPPAPEDPPQQTSQAPVVEPAPVVQEPTAEAPQAVERLADAPADAPEAASLPAFLSDPEPASPVEVDTAPEDTAQSEAEPVESAPPADSTAPDVTPPEDFTPPSQVIEAEHSFDATQSEPEPAAAALYDDLLAADDDTEVVKSQPDPEPQVESSAFQDMSGSAEDHPPAPVAEPAVPAEPDLFSAEAPQPEAPLVAPPEPVAETHAAPEPIVAEPVEPTPVAAEGTESEAPVAAQQDDPAPAAEDSAKPNIVDAPDPDDSSFEVAPSNLSASFRTVSLDDDSRATLTPLIAQLAALRDRMAAARGR